MAAGTGISGFGSVIAWGAVGGAYSNTIAEVTMIHGPGGKGDDIDITHMASPSGFREFIPGLVDAESISLDMIYTKAQCASIYALWRLPKGYQITLPDSSTWVLAGYLNAFGEEAPFDDKMTMTVGFKISGKPVFTAS